MVIPALGAHYLDVWDAEDSHPSASHQPVHYSSALEPPPLPRLKPDNLTEDAMGMESIFVGPLTERLVSALVFDGNFPFEDEEMSNGVKVEKPVEEEGEELDNVELEERIRKELRFIGILEEDVSSCSVHYFEGLFSIIITCLEMKLIRILI